MTSALKDMLSKVDALAEEDLKALQKHITEKLEQKDATNNGASVDDDKSDVHLTIGYTLTSQELKKLLFSFLTPEQWAELDNNEIVGELPTLPRPI